MEKLMTEIVVSNLLIVLAIGLTIEAIKKFIPDSFKKYLELVAIICGIVLTMAYHGFVLIYALNGVVVGFAAGKLYDKIVDAVFKNFNLGD